MPQFFVPVYGAVTPSTSGSNNVALDEGSEVTLEIREPSGKHSKSLAAAVKEKDGMNVAVFEFTEPAAGHYGIRAVFAETRNFNSSEIEQAFDKEADDAAKTSDGFNMVLWMMIMIASAAVGAAALGLRKKN